MGQRPTPDHPRAPGGRRGTADVVVVGAGPAGLLAALRAARAGHQVTVLEAAGHVGGMAASVEVAGQRVDLGSHRLHPAVDPRHRRLLGELLGDDDRCSLTGAARSGSLAGVTSSLDLVRRLPPAFAAVPRAA
ncbi:MAG: FAD-dependent oxidoreductase [Microthrixaceae bacterium]|nr:FAD-dependent oxidoreductase [Microthrixaceae bacterium]